MKSSLSNLLKFSLSTIFSLSIINCAQNSNPTIQTETTETNKTSTIKINGKSPLDYYSYFMFKKTGDCKDNEIYESTVRSEKIFLEKQANGLPIYANLDLALHSDNTYEANYIETNVTSLFEYGYSGDILVNLKFKNKWSIDENGSLILDGIGKATALKYNDRESLLMRFTVKLSNDKLVGKDSIMTLIKTRLYDDDLKNYCEHLKNSESSTSSTLEK